MVCLLAASDGTTTEIAVWRSSKRDGSGAEDSFRAPFSKYAVGVTALGLMVGEMLLVWVTCR